MTAATFANDTLTLRKIGVSFSVDLGELDAKDLRDQLLAKYPVKPEATPVAGPLHEVTLAEARPGDIATFEAQVSTAEGKFVCTLKMNGDDATLLADEWLTANKMRIWCIRTYLGDDAGGMKNLHIWRWDGVEEAVEEAVEETVELPEEPTVAGWYVTATSDQMLYNDGDTRMNWTRPRGARWSTGNVYENWEVVVRDLGSERLPLKSVLKGRTDEPH